MKTQCPTCGYLVHSIFDHITIDCEHNMTLQRINELLANNDGRDHLTKGQK